MYIKVVHGIRGFFFDSKTKMPISAVVIYVHGIEHNVTTYRDGDFFRLLSPGVYNITVERTGYVEMNSNKKQGLFLYRYDSETKERVLVTNQSSTYVEFQLKRNKFSDDNQEISPIVTLYNQSKDFVLHGTLFLFIAGIAGA